MQTQDLNLDPEHVFKEAEHGGVCLQFQNWEAETGEFLDRLASLLSKLQVPWETCSQKTK